MTLEIAHSAHYPLPFLAFAEISGKSGIGDTKRLPIRFRGVYFIPFSLPNHLYLKAFERNRSVIETLKTSLLAVPVMVQIYLYIINKV